MVTDADCREVGMGRNPFTNRHVKKGGRVHNELLLLCKARYDPIALRKLRQLLEDSKRLSDAFRSTATSLARTTSIDSHQYQTLREINDIVRKPNAIANIEQQLDRLLKYSDRIIPDAKYDAMLKSFNDSIAKLSETNDHVNEKIDKINEMHKASVAKMQEVEETLIAYFPRQIDEVHRLLVEQTHVLTKKISRLEQKIKETNISEDEEMPTRPSVSPSPARPPVTVLSHGLDPLETQTVEQIVRQMLKLLQQITSTKKTEYTVPQSAGDIVRCIKKMENNFDTLSTTAEILKEIQGFHGQLVACVADFDMTSVKTPGHRNWYNFITRLLEITSDEYIKKVKNNPTVTAEASGTIFSFLPPFSLHLVSLKGCLLAALLAVILKTIYSFQHLDELRKAAIVLKSTMQIQEMDFKKMVQTSFADMLLLEPDTLFGLDITHILKALIQRDSIDQQVMVIQIDNHKYGVKNAVQKPEDKGRLTPGFVLESLGEANTVGERALTAFTITNDADVLYRTQSCAKMDMGWKCGVLKFESLSDEILRRIASLYLEIEKTITDTMRAIPPNVRNKHYQAIGQLDGAAKAVIDSFAEDEKLPANIGFDKLMLVSERERGLANISPTTVVELSSSFDMIQQALNTQTNREALLEISKPLDRALAAYKQAVQQYESGNLNEIGFQQQRMHLFQEQLKLRALYASLNEARGMYVSVSLSTTRSSDKERAYMDWDGEFDKFTAEVIERLTRPDSLEQIPWSDVLKSGNWIDFVQKLKEKAPVVTQNKILEILRMNEVDATELQKLQIEEQAMIQNMFSWEKLLLDAESRVTTRQPLATPSVIQGASETLGDHVDAPPPLLPPQPPPSPPAPPSAAAVGDDGAAATAASAATSAAMEASAATSAATAPADDSSGWGDPKQRYGKEKVTFGQNSTLLPGPSLPSIPPGLPPGIGALGGGGLAIGRRAERKLLARKLCSYVHG